MIPRAPVKRTKSGGLLATKTRNRRLSRGSMDAPIGDMAPPLARYWGFRPRAGAPCPARTKGTDERDVGCVKRNAIAGRRFDNKAALEARLDWYAAVR